MSRFARHMYLSIVRTSARAILGPRRAGNWLAAPNEHLGGFAPMLLAGDLHGAERVLAELDRAGKMPAPR